jgi:hypothetical protein
VTIFAPGDPADNITLGGFARAEPTGKLSPLSFL